MAYMAAGRGRARFGRSRGAPTVPMLRKESARKQRRPSAIAYDNYQSPRRRVDTSRASMRASYSGACGMDLGLEGRIVVIAGASKGMGLACAEIFAREGATVVGISRDLQRLRGAPRQL